MRPLLGRSALVSVSPSCLTSVLHFHNLRNASLDSHSSYPNITIATDKRSQDGWSNSVGCSDSHPFYSTYVTTSTPAIDNSHFAISALAAILVLQASCDIHYRSQVESLAELGRSERSLQIYS